MSEPVWYTISITAPDGSVLRTVTRVVHRADSRAKMVPESWDERWRELGLRLGEDIDGHAKAQVRQVSDAIAAMRTGAPHIGGDRH